MEDLRAGTLVSLPNGGWHGPIPMDTESKVLSSIQCEDVHFAFQLN